MGRVERVVWVVCVPWVGPTVVVTGAWARRRPNILIVLFGWCCCGFGSGFGLGLLMK